MYKILLSIFLITNIYALKPTQTLCNGVGEIKYTESLYTGECTNGVKNGYGTQRYSNGMVYEGEWKNNLYNGQGTLKYSEKEQYSGHFVDGKKEGKGKYIYVNGDIYEGMWKNNEKHGYGVFTYAKGGSYEGEWRMGKREGKGKIIYASGAIYDGYWVDNKKEGKGIYVDTLGSKYEGTFKNNLRSGYGVFTYANKRVYEGNWLNDLREGEGKISYIDGEVFYGNWHLDKKNGLGSTLSQYGLCKSIWKNNQILTITNEITTKEAYNYLNELRKQAGMIELKRNEALEKSAKSHSQYIELHYAIIDVLDYHKENPKLKGFSGIEPSDRAIAKGYYSNNIGEGISNFCTAKESINSLMSEIYHRFTILSLEKDEVGIGFTQNPQKTQRNFVHNMGSSQLNKLCQGSSAWIGYYYKKVCADNTLKVKKGPYDEAKSSIRKQNPEYVLWPSANSKNNAYYFKDEVPGPMPGYAKTGNPISIEFNPYYFPKTIVMQSFRVYKGEQELTHKKILTKKTDPNRKLSRLQYAFFPIDVLERNAVYNVEFKYSYKNSIDTIKWSFSTMK